MSIPYLTGSIPFITTEQMVEVDRLMIEEYKIGLIQMMENAGRNLAHLARERFFDGNPEKKQVVVLAGTGGNGGGALVCARHLRNYGVKVSVFTSKLEDQFREIPAQQLIILKHMGVTLLSAASLKEQKPPDLIIDGLLGYGVKGVPEGVAGQMITWANEQPAPILSLDIPSGIDPTTGYIPFPAIKATATMTLALPKQGYLFPAVREFVGELYLADISVPPELYASLAVQPLVGHVFSASDLLRIW